MRIRKHTERTGGAGNNPLRSGKERAMYTDIETGKTVTTEQLYTEYLSARSEQPDEYNYTFPEYIRNCLTEHNGTLERSAEK